MDISSSVYETILAGVLAFRQLMQGSHQWDARNRTYNL